MASSVLLLEQVIEWNKRWEWETREYIRRKKACIRRMAWIMTAKVEFSILVCLFSPHIRCLLLLNSFLSLVACVYVWILSACSSSSSLIILNWNFSSLLYHSLSLACLLTFYSSSHHHHWSLIIMRCFLLFF